MRTLKTLYELVLDTLSFEKLIKLSKTYLSTSCQTIYLLNHTINSVVACKIYNTEMIMWALYYTETWYLNDDITFTSKWEKVDQAYNIIINIS